MALIKEIQSNSGLTISYWKITDWKINQSNRTADITLTPYLSEMTREEGYEPFRDGVKKIRATDYILNGELVRSDYTDYFSPQALENAAKYGKTIYNIMYEYIKYKDPQFLGSTDSF